MPAKIVGNDPALPNYARPEYIEVAPDLNLIRNELGGTRSMHLASKDYISKWSAETKSNYDMRRRGETFFEGLGRTLSAAVGMLFAKPPAMEWNQSEAAMAEHWQNIDAAGTAGEVFVKRFAEDALKNGLSILLIDHPQSPEGTVVTAANERELNLRPTWASYCRSSAINWFVETVENAATLTLLVLHEPALVRSGLFGVKTEHRYRILRLLPPGAKQGNDAALEHWTATWELWRLKNDDGTQVTDFEQIRFGTFKGRDGLPSSRLPVAIAYAGRTDAQMCAVPPLMGVAWANLSHWQLSTDLRFNTLVAGFAQPTITGRIATDDMTSTIPKKVEIGPLALVHLEAGGTFAWTEAAGTGLGRLAELVLEKLRQIGALGVAFLTQDTRAAETAEAKRLDAAAENATLATAAQGIEDAVNLALEFHAWYLGIDKAGSPVLTLSRDYEDTSIDATIMTAYVNAVEKAGLPVRLLLEAWQQGGRIASDEDLDALEMEIMANQQAIADQQAAEAEAAAKAAQGKPVAA